ncbi:MAG: hypothetical protein HQ519_18055 [Planctomycetes bacterium]|nr:hypothetical protein [Planctomycetota bacterium]
MIRFLALLLGAVSLSCSSTVGTLTFVAEADPGLTVEEAQAAYEKFKAVAKLSNPSGKGIEMSRLSEETGIEEEFVWVKYEGGKDFFVMINRKAKGKIEIPANYTDQFIRDAENALSVFAGRAVKVRPITFREYLERTQEYVPPLPEPVALH